ncbi:hypothetical protein OLX02_18025 [Novosphingobium sp. KCTC 2891]|uniref:hypothetical protein n=1 Tax=Novosphingobium sp. KCTC 2891 TaxID=2989730 RepID=UPI00222340DB|nr:hypothetical protein [Novosphingobium sp. KCTC 2891]MCW1384717.1 hypothetical protein [Novosphingobium sp. KCTC 2891]
MTYRKRIAAAFAATLGLLLAGCMLLPGRFASELDVRRDGGFAFHYKGEIVLTALAQPPQRTESDEAFEPAACSDETTGDNRDCTPEEIATQRKDWETERAARKARKEKDDAEARKAMQAMLGGIDPADPRAAQEFADRLARQEGWTSVVSKGGGVFDVEYAVKGRLDHDFSFPTIERLPLVIPFVTVIRRRDGTVRIEAPAFSPGTANPALPGLTSSPAEKGTESAPQMDGTFVLTSDGAILANNTDEGPAAVAGGQQLTWKVSQRTTAPPTALIRLH